MINKRGFQIKQGLFALLLMSMVVIAVGGIISDYNNFYGTTVDNDLGGLSVLDEVSGTADDYQGRLSPDGQTTGNFEDETFRGAFGIIKTTFASFRILFGAGGLLDAVGSRFGIPLFIIQTLVTMIVISIATAIVAIVFRSSRSNV